MDFSILVAFAGLIIFLHRMKPWKYQNRKTALISTAPFVSVIIPCRNEELRLPPALESLKGLEYSNYEIIVVDDNSTDKTVDVAKSFNVKIVTCPVKPDSWSGKNWACWQGAQVASGEVLLFTDADTIHRKDSLQNCVEFLEDHSFDMISAPPYHLCRNFFEKVLGLFLIFPLLATAYQREPHAGRLYAIGQYLVFRRKSYWELGGHQAISKSLVDDIDFAELCLSKNKKYGIFPIASLYAVQMFASFQEFNKGWIRLICLGLRRSSVISILEILCVMQLYLLPLIYFSNFSLIIFVMGLFALEWSQKQHGQVMQGSSVLAPLSVLLWSILTFVAVLGSIFKIQIRWRGRAYEAN